MERMRGYSWWRLGVVFFVHWAAGDTGSKAKSCESVRQVYNARGFSLTGVPQSEISGEHLRICPQGYTCCTSEMEENFANISKLEFDNSLRESSLSIQGLLISQNRNFDRYFQDLLNKSEQTLLDTFPNRYGELYSQNDGKIFRDLYSELRQYYRGSGVNLEEALTEFWSHLLERVFKSQSPQVTFSYEYLDCLAKQYDQLKPFGDIPREMKLKATRAFIAARSFVQGLAAAADIVKKVTQVPMSKECTREVMKLMYCPLCRGHATTKLCDNYCWNVMQGCLANQADLDSEWRNLIESLMLVAGKFNGAVGVEYIVGTIHIKISDAIIYMQENKDLITNKVFKSCGNPKKGGKTPKADERRRKGKAVQEDKSIVPSMENLVIDVKATLSDIQDYWISLPSMFCNEKTIAGQGNEDKCWNGMARARYMPERMGSGLANQINNPEIDVDITKPDMTIRQQIMQLKIMTNRLRNAYNGNDVDFQDTSDDISGSGSGDGCTDSVCVKTASGDAAVVHTQTHINHNSKSSEDTGNSAYAHSWSLLMLVMALLVALSARW
ncbi:PREDICTED: glypican-1 [Nanorana parkeri]|uniref:glypican-1 n=1 Tax=Nanorana parkeri TaxID=125878 RepID=UPI00085424C3|nr:PREDICTED: glypican-1 [Nanorana parkeri]